MSLKKKEKTYVREGSDLSISGESQNITLQTPLKQFHGDNRYIEIY